MNSRHLRAFRNLASPQNLTIDSATSRFFQNREARAGFEPANEGFADLAIGPLWYRAIRQTPKVYSSKPFRFVRWAFGWRHFQIFHQLPDQKMPFLWYHTPMKKGQETYYIHTFGCQSNKSDSERVAGDYEARGYALAKDWRECTEL